MADEFEKFPVCTWTIRGRSLSFPVLSVDETGQKRRVEHERPWRKGAKQDDLAAKATRWSIRAIFHNGVQEDGIDQPLYPDALRVMYRLFDELETGDLVIPTVGLRRVRPDGYTRQESGDGDMRDGAIVVTVPDVPSI